MAENEPEKDVNEMEVGNALNEKEQGNAVNEYLDERLKNRLNDCPKGCPKDNSKDGREEDQCIFCKIVQGSAPSHKIYEDDLSLCILDINPFTRGHCLVVPKRHVPWWHELSDEENASLFRVAKIVSERMMQELEPDFICMYARGRRIAHTHIFLVPTYRGDVLDRFFNALELFQESPPELAALREEKAMANVARLLRREK